MTAKDERVTIRVPPDLYKQIEAMAQQQRRSVSSMIVHLLDLAVMNWPYLAQRFIEQYAKEQQEEGNEQENSQPMLLAA